MFGKDRFFLLLLCSYRTNSCSAIDSFWQVILIYIGTTK